MEMTTSASVNPDAAVGLLPEYLLETVISVAEILNRIRTRYNWEAPGNSPKGFSGEVSHATRANRMKSGAKCVPGDGFIAGTGAVPEGKTYYAVTASFTECERD
jgi:hypothetical protein